jgi:hypothetical protein
MKTSNYDGRNPGLLIAVLALAGMLSATACATDPIGPESQGLSPGSGRYGVLQDENLVPINPDYANPGNLEPYGSLWSVVNETVPNDDVNYIWRYRTGLPPTNSEATLRLSAPVGTPSPSQSHTLKVRWKVVGNYSNNTPQPTSLTIQLIDRTNGVVGNGTSIPTGNDYIDVNVSMNTSLITDYANLLVRLNIQLTPATQYEQIQARITWVRLEIR